MKNEKQTKPEIISSETVYQARVFNIVKAQIRENDNVYEREIISHPGSAVIVPVLPDKTIALVKQYRHPAGKQMLELPAGTLEKGETLEECAFREVEEETGMKAGKIEKLTEFFVSPGFLDEKMHVFLATELTKSVQNLDEDEFINVHKITFPEAFEKIRKNEFEDAKTIIGLILAGKELGFDF
jgi:ADP-ribose pyrophosphatase